MAVPLPITVISVNVTVAEHALNFSFSPVLMATVSTQGKTQTHIPPTGTIAGPRWPAMFVAFPTGHLPADRVSVTIAAKSITFLIPGEGPTVM